MMVTRCRFLVFLAWTDFAASYHGSFLGIIWGLIEPIFYICLTFFFFQFVMGGSIIQGHSYGSYVLPSMLAWLVASSGVNSSLAVIAQYQSFLSENFEMRLLAVVKLLPIFVVHVLIVSVMIVLFLVGNSIPAFSLVVLLYGMGCLALVLTGVFWVLMSISPFLKDLRNIVGVALQVGFWVTPIFWDRSRFPAAISWTMLLNPFYYPVQVYRLAFVGPSSGILSIDAAVFWGFVLLLLFAGTKLYRKGKEHFGDVLI